jgi:hypothetical protein
MTIRAAAILARKQKRCVMVARTGDDMAKPLYIIKGHAFEWGPAGPRPYEFTLDDLIRADWYAADDVI